MDSGMDSRKRRRSPSPRFARDSQRRLSNASLGAGSDASRYHTTHPGSTRRRSPSPNYRRSPPLTDVRIATYGSAEYTQRQRTDDRKQQNDVQPPPFTVDSRSRARSRSPQAYREIPSGKRPRLDAYPAGNAGEREEGEADDEPPRTAMAAPVAKPHNNAASTSATESARTYTAPPGPRSRSPAARPVVQARRDGHDRDGNTEGRYSDDSKRRRSRSPRLQRQSPPRRRSPLPLRRRSPSPTRRRSPSPVRRRSPSHTRRRSPLSMRRHSPPAARRRSPSPARRQSRSPQSSRTLAPATKFSMALPTAPGRSSDQPPSRVDAYRYRPEPMSSDDRATLNKEIAWRDKQVDMELALLQMQLASQLCESYQASLFLTVPPA